MVERSNPRDGTRRWGSREGSMSFTISEVNTLRYSEAASCVNIGTQNHVNLVIGIPAGRPGEAAQNPTGLTIHENGLSIVDGLVKSLPLSPAIRSVAIEASAGVEATASIDQKTGQLTLKIDTSALQKMLEMRMMAVEKGAEEFEKKFSLDSIEQKVAQWREKWVEAQSKANMLEEKVFKLMQEFEYFRARVLSANPDLVK